MLLSLLLSQCIKWNCMKYRAPKLKFSEEVKLTGFKKNTENDSNVPVLLNSKNFNYLEVTTNTMKPATNIKHDTPNTRQSKASQENQPNLNKYNLYKIIEEDCQTDFKNCADFLKDDQSKSINNTSTNEEKVYQSSNEKTIIKANSNKLIFSPSLQRHFEVQDEIKFDENSRILENYKLLNRRNALVLDEEVKKSLIDELKKIQLQYNSKYSNTERNIINRDKDVESCFINEGTEVDISTKNEDKENSNSTKTISTFLNTDKLEDKKPKEDIQSLNTVQIKNNSCSFISNKNDVCNRSDQSESNNSVLKKFSIEEKQDDTYSQDNSKNNLEMTENNRIIEYPAKSSSFKLSNLHNLMDNSYYEKPCNIFNNHKAIQYSLYSISKDDQQEEKFYIKLASKNIEITRVNFKKSTVDSIKLYKTKLKKSNTSLVKQNHIHKSLIKMSNDTKILKESDTIVCLLDKSNYHSINNFPIDSNLNYSQTYSFNKLPENIENPTNLRLDVKKVNYLSKIDFYFPKENFELRKKSSDQSSEE